MIQTDERACWNICSVSRWAYLYSPQKFFIFTDFVITLKAIMLNDYGRLI